MKITVHRGTHEIGGNCIEIEDQGTRLILDIGMPLFRPNREPHDSNKLRRQTTTELRETGILPQVPGLFDEQLPPTAILLSHAHEDHTGLLRHSRPGIPIYASRGTSKMMAAGSRFAGQPSLPRARHRQLSAEQPTEIGSFRVTPYSVDHSIFGAMAFHIEAAGKSVLYSGDLRLHGRKPGMHRSLITALRGKHIDVLLMEGTHIEKPEYRGLTEYELEAQILDEIKAAPGLVLVSFSPQHVDRLVAFLRVAQKTERKFAIDPYTAYVLHLLQSEGSYPSPNSSDFIRVFYPRFFEEKIQREFRAEKNYIFFPPSGVGVKEICREPSKYLMIFRPSMFQSDFGGAFPPGTRCIYSRWEGYLDQPEWQSVRTALEQANGSLVPLHTSGHIFSTDAIEFVNQIAPGLVIPIHTFDPSRFSLGYPKVKVLSDGEAFEVI